MPRRWLIAPLALGLLLASGGCGDTFVDPFVRDAGSFSIYGTFIAEQSAEPQRLRVQVVRTLPDPPTDPEESAAQLGVDVTSENVASGAVVEWTESVVPLPDGTVGSIFESTQRPSPGTPYRITVRRRTDGREATVEVTTPPRPQATIEAPVIAGDEVAQRVVWDAERVEAVEAVYVLRGGPGTILATIPYDTTDPAVVVDLAGDLPLVRAAAAAEGIPEQDGLDLQRILLRVVGTNSAAWPLLPDDDGRAAQPGAYSNVTGGYGLVAVGTAAFVSWTPPPEALAAAGF